MTQKSLSLIAVIIDIAIWIAFAIWILINWGAISSGDLSIIPALLVAFVIPGVLTFITILLEGFSKGGKL